MVDDVSMRNWNFAHTVCCVSLRQKHVTRYNLTRRLSANPLQPRYSSKKQKNRLIYIIPAKKIVHKYFQISFILIEKFVVLINVLMPCKNWHYILVCELTRIYPNDLNFWIYIISIIIIFSIKILQHLTFIFFASWVFKPSLLNFSKIFVRK